MTEQHRSNGPDELDERDLVAALRGTLAEQGTPPADLPDLEAAVRAKLGPARTRRWQPLAAAAGVLVLVVGIVGAVRLTGSDRAAVPGPNPPVSSAPSRTPSVSGSTVAQPELSPVSPLVSGPDPTLTLTAVPATQPYRTAPARFETYGFDDPHTAPACTPATLSMNFVQMRTGPREGYLGPGTSTYFTVLGREIGKSPCSLDQHGLPVQARDATGKTVSQEFASTADGRPYVRVDPGDVVVFQGSWDFFCGEGSDPLTAVVPAHSSTDVAIPGWTLPGTIPVPGRIAQCTNTIGGGPVLNAVSVGRPGSFATLAAQLSEPHIVTTGALSTAVLTLANRTRTSVALSSCPDIYLTTSDIGSDSVLPRFVVMRVRCPAGFTLAAGESAEIKLAFVVAPFSAGGTRTDVAVDWYRAGDEKYNSVAAATFYGVNVNPASVVSVSPTGAPASTGSTPVGSSAIVASTPSGASIPTSK